MKMFAKVAVISLILSAGYGLILIGSLVRSEETELVMLQILFRHGERTPLYPYPNDPNDPSYWDKFGGLGLLTPTGKMQANNYGNILLIYFHFSIFII